MTAWHVAGSYFESCNCDAICPCRRTGEAEGGRSTHGVCDFALSWRVDKGHHGDESLDGLAVVMAGSYERGHERIDVEEAVEVQAGEPASSDGSVSCGIPGHDHPGTKVHARLLSVGEAGFHFRYSGVCGFTSTFDYRSG